MHASEAINKALIWKPQSAVNVQDLEIFARETLSQKPPRVHRLVFKGQNSINHNNTVFGGQPYG